MEIFLGWFVLSVVVGIIAAAKDRSGFGYFLLSLVLSPLVGGLLAICLPSLDVANDERPTPYTHVRCPDCRELVRADARKCKHCGTALTPQKL
jgi:hypothetical protein